jgi:gliding motility-associated-like protein
LKIIIPCVLLAIASFFPEKCGAQTDCSIPVQPVLNAVTVNPANGNVTLRWAPSPSPDIAAYIIYTYSNGAGLPVDTIKDPSATSHTYSTPATKYFSVTYVVAAHRNPNCTSPLSNHLNTIFAESSIDTCGNKISIKWNSYFGEPTPVVNYAVMSSANGSDFTQIAELPGNSTEFTFSNFNVNSQYSFFVEAKLEGGGNSRSNMTSVVTNMQRPPAWINADYATVEDNRIELSFTYDHDTEIKSFLLERQTGNGGFTALADINSSGNTLLYSDATADVSAVNRYRLSAMNSCAVPATVSNEASNIVLSVENASGVIQIKWNPCKQWNGKVDSYSLFAISGNNTINLAVTSDTSYTLNYNSIMYEVNSDRICFFVRASEMLNPYGINGSSVSQTECIVPVENIAVPDVFTPNGDLVNDLFKPVLSFVPTEYHLVITDRHGRIIFETGNGDASWDGSFNGSPVGQDVYLWHLKVRAPGGSVINRTGAVTVYFNR